MLRDAALARARPRELRALRRLPSVGDSMDGPGPVVAVLVNSGYGLWGGMPGNVLLAYSVEGR